MGFELLRQSALSGHRATTLEIMSVTDHGDTG